MIHWFLRLLGSSKPTGRNTTSWRRNGPKSTPCRLWRKRRPTSIYVLGSKILSAIVWLPTNKSTCEFELSNLMWTNQVIILSHFLKNIVIQTDCDGDRIMR